MTEMTAKAVEAALRDKSSPEQRADVARFFFEGLGRTQVLGVGIGKVFPIAKAHRDLPIAEIGLLLDSQYYEVRMAAAAIMDFQARQKKPVNSHRALYDLYIDRHDRLNNWDFVDRAAAYVVGQYLEEKSRAPLYELARSSDPWRRRSAIVATYYFIRNGEVDDTFAICELLVEDEHPMVQKAMGSWLRTAGVVAPDRLRSFLIEHREKLPALVIRMAIEKLPPAEQALLRKGSAKGSG